MGNHARMEALSEVRFPDGRTALGLRLAAEADLALAPQALGLASARPTIVLSGGAAGLRAGRADRLHALFADVLCPMATAHAAAVMDGGTDAGVMRLMGRARAVSAADFPLIGVCAEGTVHVPDQEPPRTEAAPLEPHHTHFVFVPGGRWGDESPWLARLASALSRGVGAVTVLVNGGAIAWRDCQHSVEQGIPVVAVAGSGRAADALAAALEGLKTPREARALVTSGLVTSTDLAQGLERVRQTIEAALTSTQRT